MSSPQQKHNKRREMDVMKLLMSDWKVQLINESTKEFEVDFKGPLGSPYEGGLWKVRVELPDTYPYKSPSIGFKNRIYHPNVDESAGSVCLDVINQTWSPLFELVNVFEAFLPQLLLYPNPTDPLNGEAAALMLREPEAYKAKVRDYVRKYASGSGAATSNTLRSSPEYTGKGLDPPDMVAVQDCPAEVAQASVDHDSIAEDLEGLLSDSETES